MAVIKHKSQRVAVLVDTQNLYHSARNLFNARVNFGAVLKEVVAGRQLVRAVAYVITTEEGTETAFFDALTKAGIETKAKPLQTFFGGAKKADWDVGMAIDAVKISPHVDVIIIASGDGDFVPLVEYLKGHCQVEVVAFDRSASARLIEAADDFLDLGTGSEFLIESRGRR